MTPERLNEIVIEAFEQCHFQLKVPETLAAFINAHREDVLPIVRDRMANPQSMLDFIANTPQPTTTYEMRVYGVAHWIMCGLIREHGGAHILDELSKLEETKDN